MKFDSITNIDIKINGFFRTGPSTLLPDGHTATVGLETIVEEYVSAAVLAPEEETLSGLPSPQGGGVRHRHQTQR